MRSLRLLALLAAPALMALVPAPPAEAGDCHGGPYAGHPSVRGGAVRCNRSGTCYVRDRCHPSTRYVIPRNSHRLGGSCGCGTGPVRRSYGPWSEMRRHMGPTRGAIRRIYVRNYFLRRYPFCLQEGQAIEEAADVGVLLAIGDEESGLGRALDDQGLLDRGAARFHVGDYAGARKDFTALLAKNAEEHRARLGLALTDVVASKWKAARRHLDVLAKAGELRADDRFDLASLFADSTKLKTLTDSLKDTVGYRQSDAEAHTVTAWLLLGQDDVAGATRFVKLATRYARSTPTRAALARAVGRAPEPKAKPKAEPEAPATKAAPAATPDTDADEVRPPNPALHREVAQVARLNK